MPPRRSLRGRIEDIQRPETLLSEPTERAVQTLAASMATDAPGRRRQDGPDPARMARRAFDEAGMKRRVFGVARFSEEGLEARLGSTASKRISCDLLDPAHLNRLPRVANLLVLVGMKFGATGQEARTWAVTPSSPASSASAPPGPRGRLLDGQLYGLTPVARGGSSRPTCSRPWGIRPQCVGRERIYEHFSRELNIPDGDPSAQLRDRVRYGVLVDLAQRIGGAPIDLSMATQCHLASRCHAAALCAFGHVSTPPLVVNSPGLSCERAATGGGTGELFGRPAFCTGRSPDALLSNGQLGHRLFRLSARPGRALLLWIRPTGCGAAARCWAKPDSLRVRDGKF